MIDNLLTKRQQEVLSCFIYNDPKILICSGGKRAGKTFVLTEVFRMFVSLFNGKGYNFILGGTTQSSIRRNVLNDLEKILGREIKLKADNHFELYGNKVYCFEGANSDSYKKARGFTSHGAFLNEATTLHDSFVKECISRCSGAGARIFMDTNPENPTHTVKVDYIDKSGQLLDSGKLNIKAFNFTLFDNDKLDPEYIESIVKSTPSGMFTDRDIYGKWVSAEGVVYTDFKESMYIDNFDGINFKKFFAGVDWGYEHHGSIVVMGVDDKDNFYLLEEVAEQHKEIEFWVSQAKRIIDNYGNINFYCDTARPEYIDRFLKERIKGLKAKKDVIAGISEVAKLMKQEKLFVSNDVKLFKKEIYNYVWKNGKDEPVKVMDDVLDSLRYAIYSELILNGNNVKIMKRNSLF